MIDYSSFIRKYLGKHYGRINPPRLFVDETGIVDFDFGAEKLYHERCSSYGDIVSWYLFYKLGEKWVAGQKQLPESDRHPILHWHLLALAQTNKRRSGASRSAIGAEIAWQFLGYHVSLIAEHADLSSKLLRRLREPRHFQGARFEVSVAAAMIVAGFDLEYVPEKGPGKHPEFIATDLETGARFAVEAKSCHRDGVLGHVQKDGGAELAIAAGRQLRRAIDKNTELPLLTFVELNLPDLYPVKDESIFRALDSSLDPVQKMWGEGCPCIGGMWVNDATIHYLDKEFSSETMYAWLRSFCFPQHRHRLHADPILRRIAEGFEKAARTPDIYWKNSRINGSTIVRP